MPAQMLAQIHAAALYAPKTITVVQDSRATANLTLHCPTSSTDDSDNWSSPLYVAHMVFGYLSIGCWIVVFSPYVDSQLRANYRRKSGDSLSLPFLFIWLLGDAFAIVGLVMSRLKLHQIVLAVYYAVVDAALIFQVYYYRWLGRKRQEETVRVAAVGGGEPWLSADYNDPDVDEDGGADVYDDEEDQATLGEDHDERTRLLKTAAKSHKERASGLLKTSSKHRQSQKHARKSTTTSTTKRVRIRSPTRSDIDADDNAIDIVIVPPAPSASPSPTHRNSSSLASKAAATVVAAIAAIPQQAMAAALPLLLTMTSSSVSSTTTDTSTCLTPLEHWIAVVCGYISAVLYVGSRVPQIYKNYKARSCEGLSIYLFLFSVLGNTTYVTAIILGHLHDRNTATLVANVPYIVGSAGTLVFDVVIFLQFFAYRGERRGYVAVQDGEEVGEDEATK